MSLAVQVPSHYPQGRTSAFLLTAISSELNTSYRVRFGAATHPVRDAQAPHFQLNFVETHSPYKSILCRSDALRYLIRYNPIGCYRSSPTRHNHYPNIYLLLLVYRSFLIPGRRNLALDSSTIAHMVLPSQAISCRYYHCFLPQRCRWLCHHGY